MKKENPKDALLKKKIGLRFKEFRQFINKSQDKLAEELQVRQVLISDIETGKAFPGLNVQHYLYIQYNLNLNWLIRGSGKMIISPAKKLKYADLHQLLSQIKENDPMYEKYVELLNLLRVPVIEKIIFAKLAETKVIAANEIKSFFEET